MRTFRFYVLVIIIKIHYQVSHVFNLILTLSFTTILFHLNIFINFHLPFFSFSNSILLFHLYVFFLNHIDELSFIFLNQSFHFYALLITMKFNSQVIHVLKLILTSLFQSILYFHLFISLV